MSTYISFHYHKERASFCIKDDTEKLNTFMSYCSKNRRHQAELYQRHIPEKSAEKELIATERVLVRSTKAAQEAEL